MSDFSKRTAAFARRQRMCPVAETHGNHSNTNRIGIEAPRNVRRLQKKKKKNSSLSKAREVAKLLKNVQHDGLADVWTNARLLAMEVSHRANKPSDVIALSLVAAESSENSKPTTKTKISNNSSKLQLRLPCNDCQSFPTHSVEHHQLWQFAIQAFANADQHIS